MATATSRTGDLTLTWGKTTTTETQRRDFRESTAWKWVVPRATVDAAVGKSMKEVAAILNPSTRTG
jgi:hypothetical protein